MVRAIALLLSRYVVLLLFLLGIGSFAVLNASIFVLSFVVNHLLFYSLLINAALIIDNSSFTESIHQLKCIHAEGYHRYLWETKQQSNKSYLVLSMNIVT